MKKIILLLIISLFIGFFQLKHIYAKDVGASLDDLTDIPILKVDDIKNPLEGQFDYRALVFRYEAHPTNPNFLWNDRPISEAPRALTPAFANQGAIKLEPGDRVTYINKFDQKVTFTANSLVHDFKINNDPESLFTIGNQRPSNPSADISISIEGEDKPTYVAFTDLDYSDSVSVKKEDIAQIVVKSDTDITYTEQDGFITFHGLQGANGTHPGDQKVWVSVLLKHSSPTIRIVAGNYTWTLFQSTKLFPKTGNVYVKHIAEDGTVLKDTADVLTNAPVGTDYNTNQETFAGYTFLKMDDTSAPATGKVTVDDQTVVYVYRKVVKPVIPTNIKQEPPTLPKTGTINNDYTGVILLVVGSILSIKSKKGNSKYEI